MLKVDCCVLSREEPNTSMLVGLLRALTNKTDKTEECSRVQHDLQVLQINLEKSKSKIWYSCECVQWNENLSYFHAK